MASAAIVLLALHTNAALTTAGVLAAAAAATSLAEARWRSRRGTATDAAFVIVAALMLATALVILLGIIIAVRPAR